MKSRSITLVAAIAVVLASACSAPTGPDGGDRRVENPTNTPIKP